MVFLFLLLRLCLMGLEADQRATMLMMCWAIWRRRNEWVWKRKKVSISGVFYMANSTLQQWLRSKDSEISSLPTFLTPSGG